MPQTELADSLKAKLWDFKYTPFLSSLVISWLILNYKIVLVFFSDMDDINDKITLLEKYISIEIYAYPLVTALIYTLLYPILSNMFYDVTLFYKNKAHETKRDREDEKVITQKEKKEIMDENRRLRFENYELENEKVQIIKEFEKKEKEFTVEIDKRIQQGIKKYKDENEKLINNIELMSRENHDLQDYNDNLEEEKEKLKQNLELCSKDKKNTEKLYNENEIDNKSLKNENNNLMVRLQAFEEKLNKDNYLNEDEKIEKLISKISQEEAILLHKFYKHDISINKNSLKSLSKSENDISHVRIEVLLDQLLEKDIISKGDPISLTKLGIKIVNRMFVK